MHPLPPAVLLEAISLAVQGRAVAGGGKAPVSACEPLCARLGGRVACVPTFTRESERGPFVREVENAVRNGWEQRCDGNFLAIFAGASIGEKSNFLSRIFE